MLFLSHSTEAERADLILVEETIQQLQIDPIVLGRHSGLEILFKCVVCSLPHKLPKKRILDGKGLTHPGPCRTAFKQEGGRKARKNEDPSYKEKRKQKLLEKISIDGAEITAKRQSTLIEKYGTKNLSEIPTIRENISKGLKQAYQSEAIVQKRQATNLERYGHTNFLASKDGQALTKAHSQQSLGVDYPFQSPKIRKKSQATVQSLYGVRNYRQLPTERNKLKEWCEQNPEKLFTSKAEQEILDWVRTYYPNATKMRKEKYELDIYIPEIQLGIEYNGLFWHSEACKSRSYHLEKTQFFNKHGIRTIHVFEHEWRDRKEQTKSFLLSALKKNSVAIGARKCEIVWSIAKSEIIKAHQLLDSTHIQAANNHSTKYVANAYYKGELIATATFGKHHRNGTQWVLTRFTTKLGYTVQGILSRMSKLASNKLQIDIISWADYRLSTGNGYIKAGWLQEEQLPPDYFYFKITTGAIISKQSRQKKRIGTPKSQTEYEHAIQDGLERIWDCGKIRYVYKHAK